MELAAVGFGTVPKMIFIISSIFMLSQNTLGLYLPRDAPRDFQKGDSLNVKVSKLTSAKTQIPYSYYSLRFCLPTMFGSPESLGDVLHLQNSPYVFKMREPQTCIIVCRVTLDSKAAKDFEEKIKNGYRANMILDNLPLVVRTAQEEDGLAPVYEMGFPVGFKGHHDGSKEVRYFIHNHLSFTIKYRMDEGRDSSRIVGFEVEPSSVKHEYEGMWNSSLTTCDPRRSRMWKSTVNSSNWRQEVGHRRDIIFTYDVSFQESDVAWSSRWDTYLTLVDDQIRWYSIANSLGIVLFLSGIIAAIMLRTLHRDISKYNNLGPVDEAREEINGWKSLHADVFRPPPASELLCIHVGIGVHLLGTTLAGFFGPRPATLPLYASAGFFSGYTSARLCKALGGTNGRKFALKASVIFPGFAIIVLSAIDGLVWGLNTFRAGPLVSGPLVFFGSYAGFGRPAIEFPVKTGEIPRPIPKRAWHASPALTVLIGGSLPFSAIYVELFYVLTSVWMSRYYHYLIGLLVVVVVVLVVVCAEASVVLCYFYLCVGDYRWGWRSYFTSGSSALYFFLYAAFYLEGPASRAAWVGQALVASYGFSALTGAIGFCACFWFTRLIYSSVKID